MAECIPRLTIGMPVYNGEPLVATAIESLLAQTFGDFELIIADNASTDATPDICRTYARHDRRIRYSRNTANIGAAENFNRVFKLARSEYFKWAGHDDRWAPQYLQRCLDVLDRDPAAILCYCNEAFHKDNGEFSCIYDQPHPHANSPKPHQRFSGLMFTASKLDPVYAVTRRAALAKTKLIRNVLGTDDVFAMELSLVGPFRHLPELLVSRRDHGYRDMTQRLQRIDPAAVQPRLPQVRRFAVYLKLISDSPLTPSQKAACCRELKPWLGRYWRVMGGEFKIVLKNAFGVRGKTEHALK